MWRHSLVYIICMMSARRNDVANGSPLLGASHFTKRDQLCTKLYALGIAMPRRGQIWTLRDCAVMERILYCNWESNLWDLSCVGMHIIRGRVNMKSFTNSISRLRVLIIPDKPSVYFLSIWCAKYYKTKCAVYSIIS